MIRAEKEADKYATIWEVPGYRDISPGEQYVDAFIKSVNLPAGASVIDLGCGAGAGGKALQSHFEVVHFLDLVKVNEDLDPFIEQPLWKPIPLSYDFGYCCDVMEHLPTGYVCMVLHNIMEACDEVFFSIALVPDHYGEFIGEELHLTVRPFTWWRELLKEFGELKDARDISHTGIFRVAKSTG